MVKNNHYLPRQRPVKVSNAHLESIRRGEDGVTLGGAGQAGGSGLRLAPKRAPDSSPRGVRRSITPDKPP